MLNSKRTTVTVDIDNDSVAKEQREDIRVHQLALGELIDIGKCIIRECREINNALGSNE
jgi:hypothetical protein